MKAISHAIEPRVGMSRAIVGIDLTSAKTTARRRNHSEPVKRTTSAQRASEHGIVTWP